jgi:hypothetical protein
VALQQKTLLALRFMAALVERVFSRFMSAALLVRNEKEIQVRGGSQG